VAGRTARLALEDDASLLRPYRSASYILFLTGTDGPADTPDTHPDFVAVDGVETRQHCSGAVALLTVGSNHCGPPPVSEVEPEHGEVQFGAAGVAEEVLCGEPQFPLEGRPVHLGVGPPVEFDRQIAPPRPQVFREVLHGSGLPGADVGRSISVLRGPIAMKHTNRSLVECTADTDTAGRRVPVEIVPDRVSAPPTPGAK